MGQGEAFPSDARLRDDEFQELRRTLYYSRDPIERLRAWQAINSTWEIAVSEWVVYARLRGCSWTEIGEALGISKQTAHARYSKAADAAVSRTPEEIYAVLVEGFHPLPEPPEEQ